jgi:hypothetical protein
MATTTRAPAYDDAEHEAELMAEHFGAARGSDCPPRSVTSPASKVKA